MNNEYAIELMTAWDAMDSAAQNMLVAQPSNMTEAASRLNTARLVMRHVVQRVPVKLEASSV